MKKLSEFKPIINLLKEEKWKFVFFCVVLFIIQAGSILEGYLNGSAVESVTKLNLKAALIYLGIYLSITIWLLF